MIDPFADPARLVLLSSERVALGGRIRTVPEDFLVEELPLFRPSGRGDHVILQVEKRGLSTFDALLRISKGAKVSEVRIGYAGLKDAQAVTRQYMSVPKVPVERVLAIQEAKLRVLTATRHTSGMKIGHHRGNRFTIRIRGVHEERIPAAREALERIARRGLPNAYGGQRFGVRQDGHLMGRAIVDENWTTFFQHMLGSPSVLEGNPAMREARAAYDAGDLERAKRLFPMRHRLEKKAASALLRTGNPREAFLALGRRPRRIWIAAWQSYLFNRILERRLLDDTFDRLLPGDIAALDDSGACYPVRADDPPPAASVPVASPTGPLLGYDQAFATGKPGEVEREIVREAGADPESFRADHVRARGHRRPLRAPVREASLEVEAPDSVVLRFVLPPGSFATVLLESLMAGPVSA